MIELPRVEVDAAGFIAVAGDVPGNGVVEDGQALAKNGVVRKGTEDPAMLDQRLHVDMVYGAVGEIGIYGFSGAGNGLNNNRLVVYGSSLHERLNHSTLLLCFGEWRGAGGGQRGRIERAAADGVYLLRPWYPECVERRGWHIGFGYGVVAHAGAAFRLDLEPAGPVRLCPEEDEL